MVKYVVTLGVALVLAVSGAVGLAGDRQDDVGPAPVALAPVVVGSGADLDEGIAALQANLRRMPSDAAGWAALALAYVEQARVTADASYYDKAAGALARSFEVQPTDNAAALAASAALASARHDFPAALSFADRALAVDEFDPTALALRVDALTELGRYDDQLRAVRRADRVAPGVPSAARFAYALELRGDLPGAAAILDRFSRGGAAADRAYLLTLLADVRRKQSRLDDAERALDLVDRVAPDHLPAQVSRARLLTARGDLDGAVDAWAEVVSRLPLPEYLVELAELLLFLDRDEEARAQFRVVEAALTLQREGGVNVDLEDALYLADHGSAADARTAAEAEWAARQSVHTADVVAWARLRDGDAAGALGPARLATRFDLHEARFWFHRGAIEAELGRERAAAASLRRGLEVDPGVSPWQADRARTLLEQLRPRP